ncbi:WXG100 family type VII secretion target [Corynebacterium macclintockiae]|uniref:ESAT-6-like protein n=1 Tax=Corynebacterium macclintockiae TaxID=2913501 RepID=A0A9X3RRA7_9CORY|nr:MULTISPECIES: WXG100 family type VII secretion target [Corynebacterium]MBC6795129.1 WXG100 family type VII secretion target [Corynebacterium sp. LK28]MCZ9304822.1 WXG100 family type VII secretion target [Corynebacterium macclintockiae]MDK8870655.1 WXG100 family type VII secretion target [Corynebacterium macclintockiae]MDK8890855.1 WXG100 family type VII secretion target [Corynebacterium macclintockiae]OFM57798.1 secretion protein [Corynebacterium sp. HMSC058E07]
MIQYNFAQISNAADDINRGNSTINGLLGDLKRDLQPMVNEWEGAASDSYQAAQKKWDDSAQEINDVLGQISRTVRQANDRMNEINTNAANSWA